MHVCVCKLACIGVCLHVSVSLPCGLHHRSGRPVLWWGPGSERWGTSYGGHIHGSAQSHQSLSTPIQTYNFLDVPFDNFPPHGKDWTLFLWKACYPIHPVCLLQAIWLLYPLCSSSPKTNLSSHTQSNEKDLTQYPQNLGHTSDSGGIVGSKGAT